MALDPCFTQKCAFGASCVTGKCLCPETDCLNEPVQAVCGSNGVTFMNQCELKAAQCLRQEPITLQYLGLCKELSVIDIDCKNDDHCSHGKKPIKCLRSFLLITDFY